MSIHRPPSAESGRIRSGCVIAVAVVFVVIVVVSYGLYRYGVGLVEDEVRQDLAGNAVLLEHLGGIDELTIDLVASVELESDDEFAFRIRGPKGSGTLRAILVTGEDGLEHVVRGVLVLENGASHELFTDTDLDTPSGLMRHGFDLIEQEVRQDLAGNAVLLEHLGGVEELALEFAKSEALAGENDFAFRVRGPKGGGLVNATVLTGEDGLEHVTRGTLTLDGGETHDLFPARAADADADAETDVPAKD
jgi:hypothetical protein